jgi:hypothetical protein
VIPRGADVEAAQVCIEEPMLSIEMPEEFEQVAVAPCAGESGERAA